MQNSTAAIIIIGNEILSGRTLDKNTQYIAEKLCLHGIDLKEVRIIPDNEQVIIGCISQAKAQYDYVFSTGGIGPTHDDITAAAIAKLFDLPLAINDDAHQAIEKFYAARKQPLNKARLKMAILPENCRLIYNPISSAPGFIIDNVYVLPGVPSIMQAMFDLLLEQIPAGARIKSKNIDILLPEGIIAENFAKLQWQYPDVEMGSYPFERDNNHGTSLVIRSNNDQQLEEAYLALTALVNEFTKS